MLLLSINYNCFAQDQIDLKKEWEELAKTESCLEGMENYVGKNDVIHYDYIGNNEIINQETKKRYKRSALEFGVLADKKWLDFLKSNKEEVVPFLINQISDVKPSKVHACPYNIALRGELAIYCLQHILKINWYEIEDYKKRYENSVTWDEIFLAKHDRDYQKLREFRHKYKYKTYQNELQKIIKSKQAVKKMIALWSQAFEKEKLSNPKHK